MYRRGVLTLVASAAVLLFAVGGWLWVRGRRVSPGKFILAPPRNAVLNFQFARETAEQGNLSPCGKCRKPAFIFKIWVARAVVVVAAGGLRAERYRSSAGTRPSDRSDPSDGRRR